MKPKKAQKKAKLEPPKIIEEPIPSPAIRKGYIVLLALGIVLLGVSAFMALSGTLLPWEQRVLEIVNGVSAPDWMTSQLAKPMSDAVWGMLGLILVLLAFPKYRLLAWQYAVAAGSTYVAVFIVEHLVGRARPDGLTHDVIIRAVQGGAGFPSGHVAVLTALGLTIWPMVYWPWRILIVLMIGAEAWARLFLGVHAPLDIVGGVAIGMAVVAVIHLTPAKIRKFFKISA